MKTMTEGNPFKLILIFSIPLLLGNLFQQAYNLVDTAIVGKILGDQALASVGVSSSVQFLVLGFCSGCSIGFSIPVATKFGAKDLDEMKKYVYTGGVLTAIIAAIITLITCLLCGYILNILKTPSEIYTNAYLYLFTIFCGLPFTLLYNYLSSILRAIGDSKTPFIFLAFSAILNICLDLFFIINLKLGCFGAALATIIAQGVSALLCFIYIAMKVDILHPLKGNCILTKDRIKHSLNIGLPMGFQMSITAIGSMVMQMSNNSLGTIYVSAYAAGLKIKQFFMCVYDSIATAVSTYVSQNYGALKYERIKDGIKVGFIITTVYSVLAMLAMIFMSRKLSMLFLDVNASQTLDASAKYLRSIGYFYIVLGFLIVSRQAIQGLGWSKKAVFAGVVEMLARTLVCVILTPILGFSAICMADQTAWISGALYLLPVLYYCMKHIKVDIENRLNN